MLDKEEAEFAETIFIWLDIFTGSLPGTNN